jgi:sulfatase modifying factor 1
VALSHLHAAPALGVEISTVFVGNPGNPGDGASSLGAVVNPFRMGRTEITNAQYVEFLNAVAASDSYSLYKEPAPSNPFFGSACATCAGVLRTGAPGAYTYTVKPQAVGQGPNGTNYAYENKPVVYVTRFDAMRYANWLHNGQGNGDTETGAYTLLGGTPFPSNGTTVTRNPDARWWLPSESEWYKAAYFNPNSGTYSAFPTRSNSIPNNNWPFNDTGSSANYGLSTSNLYPLTDAGAYVLSPSYYGTFDQGGNVWEWNEATVSSSAGTSAARRGGSWDAFPVDLRKSINTLVDVWNLWGGDQRTGFRLASAVPEPAALTLVVAALATISAGRRARRAGRLGALNPRRGAYWGAT